MGRKRKKKNKFHNQEQNTFIHSKIKKNMAIATNVYEKKEFKPISTIGEYRLKDTLSEIELEYTILQDRRKFFLIDKKAQDWVEPSELKEYQNYITELRKEINKDKKPLLLEQHTPPNFRDLNHSFENGPHSRSQNIIPHYGDYDYYE